MTLIYSGNLQCARCGRRGVNCISTGKAQYLALYVDVYNNLTIVLMKMYCELWKWGLLQEGHPTVKLLQMVDHYVTSCSIAMKLLGGIRPLCVYRF